MSAEVLILIEPTLVCSCSQIVPASWHTLKLIVPTGSIQGNAVT